MVLAVLIFWPQSILRCRFTFDLSHDPDAGRVHVLHDVEDVMFAKCRAG